MSGPVIKWLTVAGLSVFAAIWLTLTWLTVFGVGGIHTEEELLDRRDTPLKFWWAITVMTAFGVAAIVLAVVVARMHFLPHPKPVDGPPMLN